MAIGLDVKIMMKETTLSIPDVLPAARTPGEYMLVFHGDMGEERASTQADGAVVGKVFTDPYQMQLTRLLFEASAPNRYNPTATAAAGEKQG